MKNDMQLKLKKKQIQIVFWLSLLMGAFLRFRGIDYGLPHTDCRPDEHSIIIPAFNFMGGDFNPHFFGYGTLYMYLVFGAYVLFYAAGALTGAFVGFEDFSSLYFTEPWIFYLISRSLSAFLGVLSIIVVYRITGELFSWGPACIAAFLFSFAYLHVRDSHFGVTDVPLTFFLLCAVWFMVKSYNSKHMKHYAASGAFAGLAVATKYSGIFIVGAMLAVHLINIIGEEKPFSVKKIADRRFMVFCAALLVFTFAGMPYAFLDYNHFLSDFLHEAQKLGSGHGGIILGRGWWYHMRYTLPYGLGWPLFLCAFTGMVYISVRSGKKAALLLTFPLLYFVIGCRGYAVFLRYAVPLVPFFCIASAVVVWRTGETVARRIHVPGWAAAAAIAAVIIIPSVYRSYAYGTLASRKDSRVRAAEWIEKHIPAGASLYQSFWAPVQLYPAASVLRDMIGSSDTPPQQKARAKAQLRYMKKNAVPGYESWDYDRKQNVFTYNGTAKEQLPDYIIAGDAPLIYARYSYTDYIKELISSHYRLIKEFEAVDASKASSAWYDRLDAFYIPFKGFDGVRYPGPNIRIYEKHTGSLSADNQE